MNSWSARVRKTFCTGFRRQKRFVARLVGPQILVEKIRKRFERYRHLSARLERKIIDVPLHRHPAVQNLRGTGFLPPKCQSDKSRCWPSTGRAHRTLGVLMKLRSSISTASSPPVMMNGRRQRNQRPSYANSLESAEISEASSLFLMVDRIVDLDDVALHSSGRA